MIHHQISDVTVYGECPVQLTSTEFQYDPDRELSDEDAAPGHIQIVTSSVSFGTMMVALSLVLHVVL